MFSILIIDDEKNFRDVFKMQIQKKYQNVKIFEASNPVDGLNLFEKNKNYIQFVFCDYYMPIQNGSEFVEIIKKHNPSVNVALVTGDDDIDKKKNAPYVDAIFYKLDGMDPILKFIKDKSLI